MSGVDYESLENSDKENDDVMDIVSAPDASVASEVAEEGVEVMNWSDTIAVGAGDGGGGGGDDGAEAEGGAVTHAMITADGRAVPVTYNEETGQYVTEDGQAVVVQGPESIEPSTLFYEFKYSVLHCNMYNSSSSRQLLILSEAYLLLNNLG